MAYKRKSFIKQAEKVNDALCNLADEMGYQWLWEMKIYENLARFAKEGGPWYEELLTLSKLPRLSHTECVKVWKLAKQYIPDEVRKKYPCPDGERRLSEIRDRMFRLAVSRMHRRTNISKSLKHFIALTDESSLRIIHFAFVPKMLQRAQRILYPKDFSSLVEKLKMDYAQGGWGDWERIEKAYLTNTEVNADFLPH